MICTAAYACMRRIRRCRGTLKRVTNDFHREGYALDSYATVVQRLSAEFANQHSYDAVTAAVMKANAAVRRSKDTNSTCTLLEEARHRLQQLPATRRTL